jgi:hypothetical protein
MYVSKDISSDGVGVVLYKDMPYGEVYRYFTIGEAGLVTLSGGANSKFPPHGGSMLTIYMTNEEVCDFILHSAYKSQFIVDPQASAKRIREAEDRQILRVGCSYRKNGKGTEKVADRRERGRG